MRPCHVTPAIAMACALLCSLAARAEWEPPNGPAVAMLVAAETLILVDVLQTLDLKRHPELVFGEMNPLLGSHPTDERILAMGAVGALVTAGLWYAIPPGGRWIVPSVVMVLETFAIVGNARAGLSIRF